MSKDVTEENITLVDSVAFFLRDSKLEMLKDNFDGDGRAFRLSQQENALNDEKDVNKRSLWLDERN